MQNIRLLVFVLQIGVNKVIITYEEKVLDHLTSVRDDLRYIKFHNDQIPLEVIQKIDQVLNGITFLYPNITIFINGEPPYLT